MRSFRGLSHSLYYLPADGLWTDGKADCRRLADRKANQKGRHSSDIRRLATKTQLISTSVGGGPTFNGLM